jgi:hypothetical protein
MLERRPLEVKVIETVRNTEHESDEKKIESVFVVEKTETKSVTGKEIESDVQYKQEAQKIEHKSVDSVDKTERGKEIIEEPVKELDIKTEESEKYDEEEDEEEEYDDDEKDEDSEEELREEITELPSTDVQKTVVEVKSINIVDASSQPSDVDEVKLQDQATIHLSLETDTNVNDVSVDNSNADGPNLQESLKYVLLQVELPGNLTDVYETCKEVAADKPSALAHSTPLPASENQNGYVNADQTENSLEVLRNWNIQK